MGAEEILLYGLPPGACPAPTPAAVPSTQALRVGRRARGTLPAARCLAARATASCARARRRPSDRRVRVLTLSLTLSLTDPVPDPIPDLHPSLHPSPNLHPQL